MDKINEAFLDFFAQTYPYLHNHFVSYLLFLGILMSITYGNWKLIQKYKSAKGSAESIMKIILLIIEALVLAYLIWFVFVHFQTYKALPYTCFQSPALSR